MRKEFEMGRFKMEMADLILCSVLPNCFVQLPFRTLTTRSISASIGGRGLKP